MSTLTAHRRWASPSEEASTAAYIEATAVLNTLQQTYLPTAQCLPLRDAEQLAIQHMEQKRGGLDTSSP